MTTAPDYEFVGSKNSWYSAKVRACLQYKRIPYSEVCASGETIGRVKRLVGNHFYPVVVCPDGTVLQDSCDIVEALEARHPERPVIPEDPIQHLISTFFETIADEFLILSGIYYRWIPEDTREWSVKMFVQICGERMADPGARKVARENGERIAASICKRVQGMAANREDVSRRISEELCTRLDDHLRETPFLLGDRPSLADVVLMNGFYGHFYRDPGELSDHIRWRCISLALWLDHMLAAAGESDRGELFIADSLGPVLEWCGSAYADVAGAILRVADEVLPGQPQGREPPAILGRIDAEMLDTEVVGAASAYTAWKLQRLIDRYRAVPEARRAEADAWMERAGFLGVCRHEPEWRLRKRELLTLEVA